MLHSYDSYVFRFYVNNNVWPKVHKEKSVKTKSFLALFSLDVSLRPKKRKKNPRGVYNFFLSFFRLSEQKKYGGVEFRGDDVSHSTPPPNSFFNAPIPLTLSLKPPFPHLWIPLRQQSNRDNHTNSNTHIHSNIQTHTQFLSMLLQSLHISLFSSSFGSSKPLFLNFFSLSSIPLFSISFFFSLSLSLYIYIYKYI